MKSFRLQFINRDRSYTISTAVEPVKGYMVVRAPKGTTEAMFFNHGNIDHLHAMIGVPTANWPDLYEAETFLENYGLYVSAPAGSSDEYPSYYGGVYFTSKGLRSFYHETDKDHLSYEIKVRQGSESIDYDADFATDTELDIPSLASKTGSTSVIEIKNIAPKMKARLSYFDLKWADDNTYSFHVVDNDVFAVIDEEDFKEWSVGSFKLENGAYTLTIGGYNHIDDFIDLDMTQIFNIRGKDNSFLSEDATIENLTLAGSELTGNDLYKHLLLNGMPVEFSISNGVGVHTFDAFVGLKDRISWRVNIKQDTFLAISQKSPTEIPTHFTVENIGYDKWLYDHNVKYITKANFDSARNDEEEKAKLVDVIAASNDDYLIDVINYTYDPTRESQKIQNHAIFQYDTETREFKDVTMDYKTQTFYLSGKAEFVYESDDVGLTHDDFTILIEDNNPGATSFENNDEGLENYFTGTVWEVTEVGKVEKFKHIFTQLTGDALKANVKYNTVTISCKEEVVPGKFTDGGTFTGSLDEKGVDASGNNIYFPNILPKDSVTFIEVIPVNKLEDLGFMDEKGFWKGTKIVDPVGPAKDVYSDTFAGDRYCTYVNELNQKAGTLGCAWRNEYFGIISEGLAEAKKEIYDDAKVFMEVTGQEVFKEKLLAMRNNDHQTSTFISPKIITQGEFNNPNTITVSARGNGTAQYVGEFKCYDAYTGKYYWRQPIGAVGVNLARIMDIAMGGQSPAGTNTSNGCGGQLAISVLETKWRWTSDQLKILAEKKRINPICFDNSYGVIIMDDKSTQHPDETTDWSYLGHQMSFDLAKDELRDKVMAPQLFKRISPHYMEVRERQGNEIMKARCQGKDAPWSYGAVKIFEENNGTTKAKRQFVIKAECRVTPFSDTVLLIWENLPQE